MIFSLTIEDVEEAARGVGRWTVTCGWPWWTIVSPAMWGAEGPPPWTPPTGGGGTTSLCTKREPPSLEGKTNELEEPPAETPRRPAAAA